MLNKELLKLGIELLTVHGLEAMEDIHRILDVMQINVDLYGIGTKEMHQLQDIFNGWED